MTRTVMVQLMVSLILRVLFQFLFESAFQVKFEDDMKMIFERLILGVFAGRSHRHFAVL